MKEWKIEITYRDWYDIDTRTQIYYSQANTCQQAITDGIRKFFNENSNVNADDIIGVKATEDIY